MTEEMPAGRGTDSQHVVVRVQPGQITISGQNVTILLTELARSLLDQARARLTSEPQFAVLLAQIACDLQTEQALDALLNRKAPELAEPIRKNLGRSISLHHGQVYRIYVALTGDRLKGDKDGKGKVEWWDGWVASRDLRDDVAHRAVTVTAEQAKRSIDVAERYVDHVAAKVRATLERSAG